MSNPFEKTEWKTSSTDDILPAGDHVVTIESIVNGRWLPVGSVKARAGGTYAWRYRFVHLARDTIFSFRAVVERAPGWPWASERSGRIKVRVDVP